MSILFSVNAYQYYVSCGHHYYIHSVKSKLVGFEVASFGDDIKPNNTGHFIVRIGTGILLHGAKYVTIKAKTSMFC